MSDSIEQEEEHKAQIEAKHTPSEAIDVLKMAGIKKGKNYIDGLYLLTPHKKGRYI
jgi:hypothetical protein